MQRHKNAAAFQDLSRITLTMRADRVSEKGRSPASRGRNKTCSWKLRGEARREKKARKKKKLPCESSPRPQFRNNSRYDVTPALKWKPSARSSRRRRCYYSAKVKIMPVVCGAALLPRGRTLQSFFLQVVCKNTHVRDVLQNASIAYTSAVQSQLDTSSYYAGRNFSVAWNIAHYSWTLTCQFIIDASRIF